MSFLQVGAGFSVANLAGTADGWQLQHAPALETGDSQPSASHQGSNNTEAGMAMSTIMRLLRAGMLVNAHVCI